MSFDSAQAQKHSLFNSRLINNGLLQDRPDFSVILVQLNHVLHQLLMYTLLTKKISKLRTVLLDLVL